MDNKILLEDIKRMHELIGINPTILMESVITEGVVSKEAAQLLAKLFTNLEKSIVAGGKSYTKTQVKQIIGKVGKMELSREEKIVVQTLSREAISLDKTLIKRLSNEIFGEMQKLSNRQLKTKYYGEVKRGLREILPKEELSKIISGVDAKIGVKPKPTPNPNTAPNPVAPIVGGSLTDDVIVGSLKNKFKELNIPYKLTKKQEKFFIDELRTLTNAAYEQIEKTLPEDFDSIALRFKSLAPGKQREIMIQAQTTIKDAAIGLGMIPRQLKSFNERVDKMLGNLDVWKGGEPKHKIANFVVFHVGMSAIDYLIEKILNGEVSEKNVFGYSWKQQTVFRGLTSLVLSYKNIGKKFNILYTLVMAGASVRPGVEDKSEVVGDFPISIKDAQDFVISDKDPLKLKDMPGYEVTKYEPLNKKMSPIAGVDKGAYIRVYVNNEPNTLLAKDPKSFGKIKIVDEE